MREYNRFDWVDFYHELAEKLLEYKNDRLSLIEKIRMIFKRAVLELPPLERDNNIVDIDPFTVFALFNKTSIKPSNRENIIKAFAYFFQIKSPVPTSFVGIPRIQNRNATFYHFVDTRKDDEIDNLWEFFESALEYSYSQTTKNLFRFSKSFDLVVNIKGNGTSKVTMALFWIAPDTFLNLDGRNTWYLYDSGRIPKVVRETFLEIEPKIQAATYLDVIEKVRAYLQSGDCPLTNFKELSAEAWSYSEKVNKENKSKESEQQKEIEGAAVADEDIETTRYWLYSPGPDAGIWDECYKKKMMAIGWDSIGDLRLYSSKTEMKEAMKAKIDPSQTFTQAGHVTWQFVREIKPGDVVFAKKGRSLIVGRGVVESDYEFDDSRKQYKNVRKVKWTDKGEWELSEPAPMKTLTDVTAYTDYVERLNAIFDSEVVDKEDKVVEYPPYGSEEFLSEVYMDEDSYDRLKSLILNKKNVILQGAPGVGKTFVAKRLAYSIIGVKDPNRVVMAQFHQSYSYEDFIMGYRPTETGFELKRGAFYNFCKEAKVDSENKYFFVIDEINRGNLSKIFGELFMLIESDKRGVELQLLYANEKFAVPKNVYIIGMMNTADRSLAMLDYALRRRFAFFEMKPAFDSEGFQNYREELDSEQFDALINAVKALNLTIAEDESLGEGFCIGHSFFCELKETTDLTPALSEIVEYELVPLLKEYWFDEPKKANAWAERLRSAIK